MKPKTKKILTVTLALLFSIVGGASLYLYSSFRGSLPVVEGESLVAGLGSAVEITYDSMGVPQIWAESEEDAYFALGYQHAVDRMFQMDLGRRVSQGRLSELLGEATLEIDIKQRTLGFTRMAESAVESLSPRVHSLLSAYAAGVNAGRDNLGSLPFEYTMLRAEFEDWRVYDCLTLLAFQTWFSDAIQNRDEFFVRLVEKVGLEKARSVVNPYPDWAPYTVPSSMTLGSYEPTPDINTAPEVLSNSNAGVSSDNSVQEPDESPASPAGLRRQIAERILADQAWGFAMASGSNGWVVAPEKSASGGAMLCGDPHLDVTRLPQFWHLVGLSVRRTGMKALGITAPGLPFIVMGYNGASAWTMTAAGIDLTEYYSEKINPDDSSQYLTADGWREFEIIPETLSVAGWDSVTVRQTRHTIHGPVLLFDDSLQNIYSFRWAGYEVSIADGITAALDLPKQTDFQSFRETVTSLGALNANWMYADTSGTIGYQLGAPVPVRPDDAENFALDGWREGDGWSGFYPLEKTPWSVNPERGWLANCNNKQDQANLDYELLGSFFADRILRLSVELSSGDKFSLEDMTALQLDTKDEYFLRWREEIAAALTGLGEHERAEAMRRWDGSPDQNSPETALIAAFLEQLRLAIFEDELGDRSGSLKRLWVGQVYHLENSPWFDDVTTADQVETKADITERALRLALEQVGDHHWGELHSLTMRHPLSVVPLLSGALGLEQGPWSRGGTGGSLNASYYRLGKDGRFYTLAAPSWRFVIDLSQPQKARMVLPAGNSGNPMSDHFFDFNSLWSQGEYWDVFLDENQVRAGAVSVLQLIPEGSILSSDESP